MNCTCCILKNLIDAIKNIKLECNIPQPLEITGDINCNIELTQPLEVTIADPCRDAMVTILSSSSTFKEIIFKNGEQYQNATNVTLTGYLLSFKSQSQTIKTSVCSVEYVVLN